MKCSYCGEDAILISGKKYCEDHIQFFESGFFEKALIEKGVFSNRSKMEKFFEWAFGNRVPKLSDLQKWHNIIPRTEIPYGKWKLSGIYIDSQDSYICKIAQKYLENIYALPPTEGG